MTTTMQLIAKQTVGSSGAASVTFSNIPQTYTDLKVVMSTRSSGTSGVQIQFNGSTSNRSNIRLYGNGSVTASYSGSDVFTYQNRSSYTANTFDSSEIYIPNYTSSNFKSLSIDNVTETNATAVDMQLQAGLWSQTAAITSLGFVPDSSQTFVQYSTFYLYGISNNTTTQASTVPYASGGDIITTDGSYWYHTFLKSGTFTPLKALTCDYLVVAGGGGGGSYGGGGGAGGLRSTVTGTGGSGSLESPLSLTANTTYMALVGAGGNGGSSSANQSGSAKGYKGSDSLFATISSTGGGSGAGFNSYTPSTILDGGSGGGGANSPGSSQYINGGSANPSGQGYAGGRGYRTNSGYNAGGGGGGAASAGTDGGGSGSSPTSGAGGSGRAVSITGSSVTYASGGSGMAETGSDTAGANGTANRGTGGNSSTGIGSVRQAGGNGGSGIIVVRYAV